MAGRSAWPSEPSNRTRGCSRRLSAAASRSASSGRTPGVPAASAFASLSMVARTISTDASGPAPTRWLATRARLKAPTSSAGTGTFFLAPTPVVIP